MPSQGSALEQRVAPMQLWTLYGQTIDLEAFAKVHPGGELHLRLGQGIADFTKLYESYHIRNDRHHAVLKKNWGVAAPVAPSAFHQDLKQMVRDYEARVGTIKATWGHIALVAAFALATLACAYGWAMGSVPAMLCLPFSSWMTCVNSSHDSSHSAFSHRPWVNNLITWTAAPLFYLPTNWYGQHVVSHHTSTNAVGDDLDLHHFHGTKVHPDGKSPLSIWRLSLLLHWMIATIAMSYIYPLKHLVAAVAGLDIEDTHKPHFMHPKHWSLGKTVEPLILLAPWAYAFSCLDHPVLFCTLPYVVSSILFMLITQVAHVQECCQQSKVLAEPDWIKRQAMTSLDYAAGSNLWRLLTGGLNTQSLHHCLPSIASCHFTAMYPLFDAVCRQHEVEVPKRASLKEAFDEHCAYLSSLNNAQLKEMLQHTKDHHD